MCRDRIETGSENYNFTRINLRIIALKWNESNNVCEC